MKRLFLFITFLSLFFFFVPLTFAETSSITYDDRTKSVTFDTDHSCGTDEVAMWISTDLNNYSDTVRLWRAFFLNSELPHQSGNLYDFYQINDNEPEPGKTYQAWMACGNTPTEAAANGNFYHDTFIFDPNPLTISMPTTVLINTPVSASTNFTDSNVANIYTADDIFWQWGDGNSGGTVAGSDGSYTVTGSHVYTQTGVYTVNVTAYGADGSIFHGRYRYVAVYDNNTSFAGGKSYDNPTTASINTAGKVSFGVSAKYTNSNILSGSFKMNFKNASLDFASTSLQLLSSGNGKAYLTGSGTLNNVSGYTFLATGVDGSVVGGSDLVRIQIKNPSNSVIYDTQPGASFFADPTTPVATGNVRIH